MTSSILSVTKDWTTFPIIEKEIDDVECGHLVRKKQIYYQLTKNFFATIDEMKMLKRYFEYLEDHECEFMAYYKYEEIDGKKQVKFNLKLFMAAQKYFQEWEYYHAEDVNLEIEFFLANILFEKFDCENSLRRYMEGKISCQEFRDALGINDKVDQEVFHVTFVESPDTVFESFLKEEGFSLNDENRERVSQIIFEGNEKSFEDYSVDRISSKELKQAIHFNREVAEQIFDLSKVDFAAIEEYLMSIKNNSGKMAKIKNDTLLIKFYCYLVTNSVACGSKKKKAKSNRRLKVSNLEKLIR